MSSEGNMPFDLTRVQRMCHALKRVSHLSLYKKLNLEKALHNAISSTL